MRILQLICFAIYVLSIMSFNLHAKEGYTNTTKLELKVRENGAFSYERSIELLDNTPGHLITYDSKGLPESKITIETSKIKDKNEFQDLIKINISLYSILGGKWFIENDYTMIIRQNSEGTISIEGDERGLFEMSVIAKESSVLTS